MERPKRFINCYVSTQLCNFRCEYCYIGQKKEFDNQCFSLKYPLEVMKRATSKERLGGICIFNLCAGGETLIFEEIIPVIKMLLENGHNVSVVTNGTITQNIDKLLEFPPYLLEFLYFKFSFHYIELMRTGLMDVFWKNVHKVQDMHISFSVDITPYDDLVEYIPKIKKIFIDEMDGAMPHISIARDVRTEKLKILSQNDKSEYQRIWGVFDSAKFDYKLKEFMVHHDEYCSAGNRSFSLELSTGNCRICDGAPNPKQMDFYNLYDNPEEQIPFVEIGHDCPIAHCYNCHALLTLGTIKEINTPTYAEMLDRVDASGRHWLNDRLMKFYSYRLEE